MGILHSLGVVALGSLSLGAATPPKSTLVDSGFPPVRYQGEAAAAVYFLDDVSVACGKAAPGYTILACAQGVNIALPNPCKPEFRGEVFARIACHELGHRNGWNRYHED